MCKKDGKWWNLGYEMEITHENMLSQVSRETVTQGAGILWCGTWMLKIMVKNPKVLTAQRFQENSGNKEPQSAAPYQDRPIKKQATWLVEFPAL